MGRYKRFLAYILLISSILGMITGCKRTGIIREEGQYYLIIDPSEYDANDALDGSLDGSRWVAYVKFSSLEELLTTIQTGNFTDFAEEDWKQVRRMMDESGRIRLFDLENIYCPVTPASYQQESVRWYGHYIDFRYNGLYAKPYSYEQFQTTKQGNYYTIKNYIQRFTCKIDEVTARVYDYYISVSLNTIARVYEYNIELEDKEIYVSAEFRLIDSEEVPEQLVFVVSQDGQCYRFSTTTFTEPPSVEWLSSFGIQKYEG